MILRISRFSSLPPIPKQSIRHTRDTTSPKRWERLSVLVFPRKEIAPFFRNFLAVVQRSLITLFCSSPLPPAYGGDTHIANRINLSIFFVALVAHRKRSDGMANSGAAPGSGATGPRGGSYQLTGAPRGSPIPPAALPPPNLPVAGTGGYSGYASHPPYPPQPPPASSNSQGAASSVGYHSSYSIPPSAHIPYPPYAHPPATSSPGFFAPPPPLQAYSTIPPGTSLQTSRVPLSARSFPTNSPTQSQSATTSPRPNTEPENYEIITPQQMAQIQNQIRRYKALAKKYNDMKASLQSSAPPPEAVPAPSNVQTTWQAHHLIAGLGSTVAQEGMIGLNVSDLGPQSKISPHVSPITLPQLLQLREKCFKDSVNSTDSATIKLLALQRSYRSNIIGQNVSLLKASLTQFPLPIPLKTPLTATGPPPTEIRLLPPDQFYRSKKNSKRDLKMTEKDLKRRNKTEKDEGRRFIYLSATLSLFSLHSKRNHAVFVRDVMSYREEFLRFHKGKYLECSKAARAVKQWIETMEVRKEKKDIKAGLKFSILSTNST